MKKRVIKLNENDLHKIVKNVVKEIIENDEEFDDVLNNYEPFVNDEDENGNEE